MSCVIAPSAKMPCMKGPCSHFMLSPRTLLLKPLAMWDYVIITPAAAGCIYIYIWFGFFSSTAQILRGNKALVALLCQVRFLPSKNMTLSHWVAALLWHQFCFNFEPSFILITTTNSPYPLLTYWDCASVSWSMIFSTIYWMLYTKIRAQLFWLDFVNWCSAKLKDKNNSMLWMFPRSWQYNNYTTTL